MKKPLKLNQIKPLKKIPIVIKNWFYPAVVAWRYSCGLKTVFPLLWWIESRCGHSKNWVSLDCYRCIHKLKGYVYFGDMSQTAAFRWSQKEICNCNVYYDWNIVLRRCPEKMSSLEGPTLKKTGLCLCHHFILIAYNRKKLLDSHQIGHP